MAKRKRPSKSARAKQPKPPAKPPTPPAPPEGDGGLIRPNHVRSDSRLVARMISLGVVSEEVAKEVLASGFGLAARAIQAGKGRDYAAVMRIMLEAAKLERDHKATPQVNVQANVQVNLSAAMERLTDEQLLALEALDDAIEHEG